LATRGGSIAPQPKCFGELFSLTIMIEMQVILYQCSTSVGILQETHKAHYRSSFWNEIQNEWHFSGTFNHVCHCRRLCVFL